ncbi:hypothetical protein GGG16DRAFT_129733 [Schizophyllum commune]
MPRTKHPPRNSKPSKEIQRPASPRSKFIFNGARLNRLLLCTLVHEPWLAGYRQVKPTYKAIAAEYNKGLPEKEHIKDKTAQEKVKQLIRIRRDGGQPTKELRAVFESGEDVQFSALLDQVVKEFDNVRDRKAAKSAARAKERHAAAASATTDTAATLTTATPTTPQLSESSAAPTSSSSSPLAPFATGPLHDMLSQFMSIQNRLLHIIAEELKKQNGMIQQILNILTGYSAFSSPPPPSPYASPSSPLSTPSPTTSSSSSSQAQSSTADEMDVDKEDIAPDVWALLMRARAIARCAKVMPKKVHTRVEDASDHSIVGQHEVHGHVFGILEFTIGTEQTYILQL